MLASDHPDVSDRIVLMAPTLEPSSQRASGRATRNLLRDALREPPVVFGIAVTDYLFRCGVPYLLRQVPHMLEDAIETRVGELRARVLIVNGDRDPIVSTRVGRRLSRLARGHRVPRGARPARHHAHRPGDDRASTSPSSWSAR